MHEGLCPVAVMLRASPEAALLVYQTLRDLISTPYSHPTLNLLQPPHRAGVVGGGFTV